MFLLNLTLGQLLALFGAGAAFVLALYLLDRTRQRQRVATLRFWVQARNPAVFRHRRKLSQPWSLLLQLLGLFLLLLAVAQPRIGSRGPAPGDHVLVLDTSAWMGAAQGDSTLIERARQLAIRYVRALPAEDRVMLLHASGVASPATFFENDREKIIEAIRSAQPSATSLNLEQALRYAGDSQRLHARRAGEIALVTAGRLAGGVQTLPGMANLRVIQVESATENAGLRKVGLRRATADPELWEVFVTARNYGTRPREVSLGIQFAGALVGTERMRLDAGAEREASFRFRTRSAGWLEARLLPDDAFRPDNYARLEVPGQQKLRVEAIGPGAESLRPLLQASPLVEAVYRKSGAPDRETGLTILDRTAPASPLDGNAIWIQPPPGRSPVPVLATRATGRLKRWRPGHPLTSGLGGVDFEVAGALVFDPAPGDIVLAEAEAGPVAVARPGPPRQIVLGFHPTESGMRYDLAAPLLFANALEWMAPGVFRRPELFAGTSGTVSVPLDPHADPSRVSVRDEAGNAPPFTIADGQLRFFAGHPGTFQVESGSQQMTYTLTLPEAGEVQWEPPPGIKRGVPPRATSLASGFDAWWLAALLGACCFLFEWLRYGRLRRLPSQRRAPLRFPALRLRRWLGAGSARKAS